MISREISQYDRHEAEKKDSLNGAGGFRKYSATLFLWSTAFTGIFISVGGVNLNPERLLFLALFVPISYMVFEIIYKRSGATYSKSIWFLFFWNFFLLIPMMASHTGADQLRGFMICAIPTLMCFYFATSSHTHQIVESQGIPIVIYLSIGGIIVFTISPYLSTSVSSIFIGNLSNDISVKLTTIEPNIYGSTLAFFTILNLHRLQRGVWPRVLLVISIIAVLLSFSRGPYVAFFIGAFFYLILSGDWRRVSAITGAWFVVLSVLVVWMVYPNAVQNIYDSYLNRDTTIGTRATIIFYALERVRESPIIGHGPLNFTSSMSFITNIVGATDARQISISQMFVAIMHDSGALGVMIYSIFLVGIMAHGFRMTRGEDRRRRAAYLSAFLTLLLASQITTVYYMALFGIAAGVVASGKEQGGRKTIERSA